ncbi:hypothetical protein [Nocardioides sp.]|uniref:hypothetical protein n=1 Tax=Nocardioides sp. TaxID=35761 RepID=UPI002D7E7C65|nr:hypothetical protein [Nocardioides sp.]
MRSVPAHESSGDFTRNADSRRLDRAGLRHRSAPAVPRRPEEVWINDPSRVFIAKRGRHELTNLMLSSAQVRELVERMAEVQWPVHRHLAGLV